jgi:Notch-like protein
MLIFLMEQRKGSQGLIQRSLGCLSHRFVVVMGVDLSHCGPDHPTSRCPWDSGLLLRFLAAMTAVGALEPLLPGPLLAAHPYAGTGR